jgi:hypothetical protein
MNGMLRVPRSRGALSGLLLVLLGAWGALVPFIGPYFHYAYTPDSAWTYTTGRFWLEILPGCATVLGGLIVLGSSSRPFAIFGAWLAAASGAWFALGNVLAPIFSSNGLQMNIGAPVGGTVTRALEQIGFFTGLGVAIVLLAGMAIGRFSVVGVRETRLAERAAAARAEREAAEQEAANRTEPVAPAATAADAPATTSENAAARTESTATDRTEAMVPARTRTGAWKFVPGHKSSTDADTGTTTADTRAESERVDTKAAQ